MKCIRILLLLTALVAIEATPQGLAKPLINNFFTKCETDEQCATNYGCRCDRFSKICVGCKECTSDAICQKKYGNPDSGCKCAQRLCFGCV